MPEYDVWEFGVFFAIDFIESGKIFKRAVPHVALGVPRSAGVSFSVSAVVVGNDYKSAFVHKLGKRRISVAAFRHTVGNLYYPLGVIAKPFAIGYRLAVICGERKFIRHNKHLSTLFCHSA